MKIAAALGALALLAVPAKAQTGEWRRVQMVKAGATILVGTQPDAYSWPTFDRCRLLQVDRATLTCIDLDVSGSRLTFPRRGIEAVYVVTRQRITVAGVLALALTGLLIGGLASGNVGLLALSLAGLSIELGVMVQGPHPPPQERRVLVYRR